MTERTACFMVEDVLDCFIEGGGYAVGAMAWVSHGRREFDTAPRPMPHLMVMTPAGLACLDCPATDAPHGYWVRAGTPPRVTVTPSLNISNDEWHGWLTDGTLVR